MTYDFMASTNVVTSFYLPARLRFQWRITLRFRRIN